MDKLLFQLLSVITNISDLSIPFLEIVLIIFITGRTCPPVPTQKNTALLIIPTVHYP